MISPCLSNIFLHHVLDEWFEHDVRPRLKGRCTLVRFADDAVMAFEHMLDAQRVLGVLGKRLARYGLTLHPDKTRFVDFRNTESTGTTHPEADGTTFTFLGFTHIWGKSRAGNNVVRQVTAKNRYARALAAVTACCRINRHQSISDQHAHFVTKDYEPTAKERLSVKASDEQRASLGRGTRRARRRLNASSAGNVFGVWEDT